jgi:dTDP-4-dehydrorhamnose 3,5-epimerase
VGPVTVFDIKSTPLKRIAVEGGDVLHALKIGEEGYVAFGEAYFSCIEFKAIKAWKRHLRMTLNLVVPVGMVQFVFIDGENQIREEFIGVDSYRRLTVPPGIWFGFRGAGNPSSILLNVADIKHDQNEIERKLISGFNYRWS